MSILDDVLNETQGRIIGEQHDLSQITVEADAVSRAIRGLSGGRGWDAIEYGMTEAQARAAIEAADTPEARARVMQDLRQRAIRRASLDTSNGRVNAAFALKPAWHGLGVVVNGAMTSAEALRLAGMDWRVSKRPLRFENSQGGWVPAEQAFAVVRDDTETGLGTVGGRYAPIQNVEGFAFLDSVIGEFGATYESAGSIYGGKSVWMLAHMPSKTFRVNGDQIEPYILFSNCHDGTGAANVCPTTVRVECANTFRTATKDRHKGLSIRHTGNVKAKIGAAREALGLAVKGFEEFKEQAEYLVNKPCNPRHYANDVLDAVLDITEAEALKGADALAAAVATTQAEMDLARKSYESKIDRREEILIDILQRYESERCHPKGSAWAAFNSVTEYADHNQIGRKAQDMETRMSRRFESVMTGERDEIKQTAFAKAMTL